MTVEEQAAALAEVHRLEHEVFDGEDNLPAVTRETARAVIDELNAVRSTLGWLEIDSEGHWRWPAS